MAIVKMMQMNLLALEQDRPQLLAAIQKLGCAQILPVEAQGDGFHTAAMPGELPEVEERIARIAWAIGKLNKFDTEKKPLMADKPSIAVEQAQAVLMRQAELMTTVERLEALEQESGELRGQIARIDAAHEQLQPWQDLPMPLSEVQSTRNTIALLGTMPKTALDTWTEDDATRGLFCIDPISLQRDQVCVYLLIHRAIREEAMQKLKEAGFTPFQPQGVTGTIKAHLERLEDEKRILLQRQQAITAETAENVTALNDLKKLHDLLDSHRAQLLAAKHFAVSGRTFFLKAWVPEPLEEKVQARLLRASSTAAISFEEPPEGEEPPVLLHNRPTVSPFEPIVSGFSLPAPLGVDPTAVMMPFFINFMGMMVSDAGYGLMMAILAPLLIKILRPAPSTRKLLWIIMGGGIMTVFWGAMYNTWFGFALFSSPLDPMNNALPVMGICIGLGAVHLFAGLGMAAYLNIRRGQWFDVIADQLSWFLLVVGLVLLAVVPAVGQWMALAGAGLILLFAGRAKTKNPFKRLLSGLGALYGITGWISDLLSYIRLFGMGLATGVIGMVINILVGMVIGHGVIGLVMGVLVFAGGHLFNAGINIFGAYVHSCRLQYIEFFGKFYEDGGKPFKPLAQAGRYVTVRDAEPQA